MDHAADRDAAEWPALQLTGESARVAERHGAKRWHVSITHTDTHAMASAIAESAAV